MTVNASTSFTKIPGYFAAQVHPEHEAMPIIEAAQQALDTLKQMTWNQCRPLQSPSPAPNPVLQTNAPDQYASQTELYHFHMTSRMINYLNEALDCCRPESIYGYLTALLFIEKHLLATQISDLTPNTFLDMINRINLCVNKLQHAGFVYRASDGIVYSDNMPTTRTAEEFKKVDRFIQSQANEKQIELWKTTRTKIWNMSFAKVPQSISLNDEEKKLVRGLMEFQPPHEQVPALMHQFAEEFCAKVADNEDLDKLCAWSHQELVKIHPYWDGDGRTARLLMNLLRMWAGEKPLLFDGERKYTQAVRSSDPQGFYNYLQELKTQSDIDPFIDQCLRFLYETLLEQCDVENLLQNALNTPFTHAVKRK